MNLENSSGKIKTHLPWLDLVRFISAFVVLIGHTRADAFVEWRLLPDTEKNIAIEMFYFLTRLGNEAVVMFFVLSGFFIMGSGITRYNSGKLSFKKYAIDRFARIMLPLVSALLLLIIVNPLIGQSIGLFTLIGNLFSLQGILCGPAVGPFWSLSYEVWFYILFGAILFIIAHYSKANNRMMCVWAFTVVLISFLCFTRLSPHYLFIWCLGGLAYLTLPKKGNKIILTASLIGALGMIVLLQISKDSRSIESISIIDYNIIEILLGVFYGIIVQQLSVMPPKTKFALKVNLIGSKLAAFSYTLYLTHQIVINTLFYIGFPQFNYFSIDSVAFFIIELMTALFVAYVIYLLFERNTAKFKLYLESKLSKVSLTRILSIS